MYTETQQRTLVDECHQWHDELVAYREKINRLKSELYYFAPGKTEHDVLLGIEHFHNQFHIQLINIHDLKHEIKHHLKEAERASYIRAPHTASPHERKAGNARERYKQTRR